MKHLSRFDINREFKELSECMSHTSLPLAEQFLKAEDPSLAVLDFIEKVGASMSQIKKLYASSADNRNAALSQIMGEVNEIGMACNEMAEKAKVSKVDPEDTNDKLDTELGD